jgi:hypothetical protein
VTMSPRGRITSWTIVLARTWGGAVSTRLRVITPVTEPGRVERAQPCGDAREHTTGQQARQRPHTCDAQFRGRSRRLSSALRSRTSPASDGTRRSGEVLSVPRGGPIGPQALTRGCGAPGLGRRSGLPRLRAVLPWRPIRWKRSRSDGSRRVCQGPGGAW